MLNIDEIIAQAAQRPSFWWGLGLGLGLVLGLSILLRQGDFESYENALKEIDELKKRVKDFEQSNKQETPS